MCLNSWGQGMREIADPGDQRIVLRDEAWMQTRLGVEAVKTLDSNLRLSRNDGDIQLVTYHKPSDPLSAGDQGSQAAQIAKDLLHLADIRILMGQDHEVAAELGHLLGLTPMHHDIVTGWAMQDKGRALWMVGDRRYKVQTLLTPLERRLTYTNDAIATRPQTRHEANRSPLGACPGPLPAGPRTAARSRYRPRRRLTAAARTPGSR